jgi:hypothetical protein
MHIHRKSKDRLPGCLLLPLLTLIFQGWGVRRGDSPVYNRAWYGNDLWALFIADQQTFRDIGLSPSIDYPCFFHPTASVISDTCELAWRVCFTTVTRNVPSGSSRCNLRAPGFGSRRSAHGTAASVSLQPARAARNAHISTKNQHLRPHTRLNLQSSRMLYVS